MKDWEEEVLKQYDIDIKNIKKVRNGMLCEAEQQVFLIEGTTASDKRLSLIRHLGEELIQNGFEKVDHIILTQDGNTCCQLEDGSKYILKKWFRGSECDVKKENELLQATQNLTQFHTVTEKLGQWENEDICRGEDLQQVFFRHNRELKKVRSFIRQRVDKGEFENAFLSSFDFMFEWAEGVLERLKKSNYKNLKKSLIHGDYNYHNLIMMQNGIATTNFGHFEYNVPMKDFYYFLRKAMEKNHWDVKLGSKMIDCYHRMRPISLDEMEYISICIAYPEKFWKAANSYARSKKCWIPAKNIEKLELVARQTEEKRIFLEKVFNFRL